MKQEYLTFVRKAFLVTISGKFGLNNEKMIATKEHE